MTNQLMTINQIETSAIHLQAREVIEELRAEAQSELEKEQAKSHGERSDYLIHELKIVIEYFKNKLKKL